MGIFQRIKLPVLILFISEVLLIFIFPASFVFESTMTAGADTPSHLIEDNPDNRICAESLAWLAEASLDMDKKEDVERFFRRALFSWSENDVTKQAGLRLAEMIGAAPLLEEAKGLLASGKYLEACNIYGALALSTDKKIRDQSVLSLASCSFYMNRWQEASDLFLQWLNDNLEAPESARVQADLRRCQAIIFQNGKWMRGPDHGPVSSARFGVIVRFFNRAARIMH